MENQRIRISKAMLKEALIQLLQEKAIGKISIYELCDRAQVNRTTFYKYYGSQYDLLEDIEADIFEDLERLLLTVEDGPSNLGPVLDYLIKERRKCLVFINSTVDKQFAEKLFNLSIIREQFEKNTPGIIKNVPHEYVLLFFCHGAYAIIVEWLNKENRESTAEISDAINALASKLYG